MEYEKEIEDTIAYFEKKYLAKKDGLDENSIVFYKHMLKILNGKRIHEKEANTNAQAKNKRIIRSFIKEKMSDSLISYTHISELLRKVVRFSMEETLKRKNNAELWNKEVMYKSNDAELQDTVILRIIVEKDSSNNAYCDSVALISYEYKSVEECKRIDFPRTNSYILCFDDRVCLED